MAELAQGALAWAEQASEGCPVSFERAVELSGDEPALFVVLVAAVRRAKTDAVRAQLEGWLAARSWDIHGKRALSTGSRK